MGLVTPDGDWENYDGLLRFTDSEGKIVAQCDPLDYERFIAERVEKDSYLKSPYFKPAGYPQGVYRVGPLARVNICRRMGVPLADKELNEFRQRAGGVANASFFYPYARLLEILACLELLERLLPDAELQSDHLRAEAGVNRLEGIGVSEAPRGTLFPSSLRDRDGLLQKINPIIAMGQNVPARTHGRPDRQALRQGGHARGADLEPHRSWHPCFRSLLELLDACRRPDAPRHRACAV